MKNLWIEHWVDDGSKNKGHSADVRVGVDIFAKVGGRDIIIGCLVVNHRYGYPRLTLTTVEADTRVEV